MTDHLYQWVIYCRPRDFPAEHVVRRWRIGAGTMEPEAKPWAVVGSLEEARAKVPAGLYRIVRDPKDDPVIVETWI